MIDRRLEVADRIHATMLSLTNVDTAATQAALSAGRRFVNTVAQVSGIQATKLVSEPVNLPWLRKRKSQTFGAGAKSGSKSAVSALDTLVLTAPTNNKSNASLRWHNPAEPTHASRLALVAEEQPWQAAQAIGIGVGAGYMPTPAPTFCVPANPILKAMRLRAELNLYKIRTCRNIAGMKRELEPYAAPTDTETGLPFIGGGGQLVVPGTMRLRPTQYRYPVLVERAKQLIGLAQQAESAFLAALEKEDAERYTLLRARHDLGSARAGVKLQRIRSTEAREGVKLAELQRDRAQISVDHFSKLLAEPISSLESLSLRLIQDSMQLSLQASLGAAIPNIIAGMASGSMVDFSGIYANIAQAMRTQAEVLSTLAGYERRAQGWQHEKSLAEQDVKIGEQQIRIAEAHERVVAQVTTIAELQQDHAEAVIEFLTTKFTNIELWTFMVPQLERVYAHLLRHATAVAKLAENQLAFERQQLPPARIADDYWTAPDAAAFGERGPDRRGLTGSARLLADLTSLDQYAFQTNQRKLQLTRTISLAGGSPAEFQLFRQTGVMNFMTTLRDFDRQFPGHYMRTIRRVRISFIALIPPAHGVRATLSAAGTSRVVIGDSPFQTTTVFHGPQSVAFSSPRDATGVFELDPQPDLLLPFEGIGVETGWEIRAPKAANVNLDYATIADVLVTIEYTALNSFDYRQQVIQSLPTGYGGDRPYSFRHHLADQWFDLHNPDQSATPMSVAFQTRREDFPTNLESIEIKQIAVSISCAGAPAFEIPIKALRFMEHGGVTAVGGAATTTNGVASTFKGNAGAWMANLGKQPFGDWELQLPNTAEIRQRFRDEQIEDILLVITFGGQLPPWPG